MTQEGPTLSAALLAAQDLLLSRRRNQQKHTLSSDPPSSPNVTPPPHAQELNASDVGLSIPNHLGWGSDALSKHLRTARQATQLRSKSHEGQYLSWLNRIPPEPIQPRASTPSTPTRLTITLYPEIALAMLRQEQTSAGRIWLLLRQIDVRGAGWVDIKDARAKLTDKQSELKVCGWRQLRNLLAKGEDLFWQRSCDRIWLRSVAKVAAALDVRQLKGNPVAIPVDILTQGMGPVRAHFYASFHSGRTIKSRSGTQKAMPIARRTIRQICRISRRTQRTYEAAARVRTRNNYAIGPQATADIEQESAWQHGHALFQLTDHKGSHGAPGTSYLAWQLPNSYFGPHARQPRGRQKRINRELADLFTQGMTGNGEYLVKGGERFHPKRFYGNGSRAAKAYNGPVEHDVYWCTTQDSRIRQGLRFWHCLPAQSQASR